MSSEWYEVEVKSSVEMNNVCFEGEETYLMLPYEDKAIHMALVLAEV